jgi:poly [ADP-ribose] polymerase
VLDQRVRDLVSLIFDKQMMVKALQVMKVDVKKMPLGKISRRQIQQAYAVLSALSEALQQQPPNAGRVGDCTNRFYTLVPHDFGEASPPLINTDELVKQKIELLDVLCDIEVANKLMEEGEGGDDKVLCNYRSLRTRITPVERDGELWKMIARYAYDTHDASFFKGWTFAIDDIFEIEREGELERFRPWADNPNRALLWHGSRLTNYVGILSNGLRIAPPEAPKTGYRFGKGAYFADVSSKSASYCFTTRDAPKGIMILNEVALGTPFETPNDIYMEKPQPGTNCTWALGMTVPDPKVKHVLPNGTVVPFGKLIPAGKRTMCSHNEFIVYDVAQVVIRYALRVTFTHK